MPKSFMSPPELAERLGVNPEKIIGFIRDGLLVAVNVAANTRGRPRWRISEEAVDAFLLARQSKPPQKSAPRARRQSNVISYY